MISVVVCTHNGKNRIIPSIDSLVYQQNPPEFEIIIVDNASSDGTDELVKRKLSSSFPLGSWKVIREEKPGLLNARMAGLRSAQYNWILFCDDDNVLFQDFLAQSAEILVGNPEIGVLGSLGIPEFSGAKPYWFDKYSSSFAVGVQEVDSLDGQRLVYVYGACSIYNKTSLLKLFSEGFKPALSGRKGKEMSSGEDVEWCWLMQLMGNRIAFSELLKFYHQLPASRLNWEYYLQLKRGISSSYGLLSSYTHFFNSSKTSTGAFVFDYYMEMIKSIVRFVKYWILWKGSPKNSEDQLAYVILKSKMIALIHQRTQAIIHYKQLKDYFGA